jgi:hypothetical protein
VTSSEAPGTGLPPLPPMRRRRASRTWRRHTLSHDDRRLILHESGYLDPERLWLANIAIAKPPWWAGLFGDPRAVAYVVPQIIIFPERRSEIARLRAEVEELARTFRCVEVA